jgi:transposase-like protein
MNASGSSSVLALPVSAGVIAVTDRWFLRYGLPYRDLEELPAERRHHRSRHHRSRHHLSLGTAVHARIHRRRLAVPSCFRQPVVRR